MQQTRAVHQGTHAYILQAPLLQDDVYNPPTAIRRRGRDLARLQVMNLSVPVYSECLTGPLTCHSPPPFFGSLMVKCVQHERGRQVPDCHTVYAVPYVRT